MKKLFLFAVILLLTFIAEAGSFSEEGVLVARGVIGRDHIAIKDHVGRRVDWGQGNKWLEPLSLKLGNSSAATFEWEGVMFQIEGDGQMVLGDSSNLVAFPELSEFKRLDKGEDLFLLKGALNVQGKEIDGIKKLRSSSHLLGFGEAIFRIEASKNFFRIDVLDGSVEIEDLWFFPGEKFKLKAMEYLQSDKVKGNEKGVIDDKRAEKLNGKFYAPQMKWLDAQGASRLKAFQKIYSEKLDRRLDRDLAAERRVELKLIEKEAHFRVDY